MTWDWKKRRALVKSDARLLEDVAHQMLGQKVISVSYACMTHEGMPPWPRSDDSIGDVDDDLDVVEVTLGSGLVGIATWDSKNDVGGLHVAVESRGTVQSLNHVTQYAVTRVDSITRWKERVGQRISKLEVLWDTTLSDVEALWSLRLSFSSAPPLVITTATVEKGKLAYAVEDVAVVHDVSLMDSLGPVNKRSRFEVVS